MVRDRSAEPEVLRVEALSVSFGGIRAVNDVTFGVRRGEILGLIGPNEVQPQFVITDSSVLQNANSCADLKPSQVQVATVQDIIRVTGSRLKWREAGAIASLGTWIVFSLVMFVFIGAWDGIFAGLMTLLLIGRHKKNFQNLF